MSSDISNIKKASTLFMGGVGNMMFQTSMLYSYCKKYGYELFLSPSHSGTLHNPPLKYKDNIFRNFNFLNPTTVDSIEWSLYEEQSENRPCKYIDLPNFNVDNIMFKGFFQSYKYFDRYKSEIQNLFKPNKHIIDNLKNKYSFVFNNDYVSLHIRRGDYVNLSQYHHNLSIDYYKNAVDYFKGYKFLIFSDDIEWCKKHFNGSEFFFIENEPDYIDLYLMGLCKHNVIANSTFSWWGAYLNLNPDKIVVHPNKWFGIKYENLDISDLFPDDWICLNEKTPKTTINLMGNICQHLTKPNNRWSTVHNKISSDVCITRNQPRFEGVSIFSDDTIESNLFNQIQSPHKIGWLMETREVSPGRYQNFDKYKDNYDFVLTHDSYLLENYPDKAKFIPFGGCWIKDHNFNLYPKSKLISMVLSDKKYMPGHKLRHQIANILSGIDLYGRGTNQPIKHKETSLKDYYFSIVIENSKTNNYFTEKLLDCFATGTLPIYWGCSNIGNFFNTEGIIILNDIEDLESIIPLLTPEYYNSKIKAIKENLTLCRQYNVIEDWLYNNIISKIDQK